MTFCRSSKTKEQEVEKARGEGLMPGVPLQKKVPVSANKWQLRSELRLQRIKNKVAGTYSL